MKDFIQTPRGQQLIAFAVVAAVALWILWRFFVKVIAPPLAARCLKNGHVKLAMRLRKLDRKNCCG